MSSKTAKSLIISNLSMLETVKTVYEKEINLEICNEICKLIGDWAKEQMFDGEYDLYEEECFWFAPESWKYRNEQDKYAWIASYDFVLVESGKEIEFCNCDVYYFLSPFINVGQVRAGIKFFIDLKSIKSVTQGMWKKFIQTHESYNEFRKLGFETTSSGNWFITLCLDSIALADAYESDNVVDALSPISECLDKIKKAHPLFEKLMADAKINFGL